MGKRRPHGRGPPGKRRRNESQDLSARQKKHLKAFGEAHPADIRDAVKNYTKVDDVQDEKQQEEYSSSSESEDEDPYKQLLATIGADGTAEKELSEEDDSSSDTRDTTEDETDDGSDDEGAVAALDSNDDNDSDDSSGRDEDDTVRGVDKRRHSSNAEHSDSSSVCGGEVTDGKAENGDDADPFSIHFERDLPEDVVERLSSKSQWEKEDTKVKHKLADQVAATNVKQCGVNVLNGGDVLTPLQYGLFGILNNYQDLLYPRETFSNTEEIRLVYCLHAVNHVLKTRSRVMAHNTKIRDRSNASSDADKEYRDQGLTRPKVLMVVPMRHAAYRIVQILISLLSTSDQVMVSNRKRFKSEYGDAGHDDDKKGLKPEDYDALFTGNTDEHFRIGLSVSKKSLRLYSPFYMADIIIASPLGLRTVIGAQGDRDRDYDFLSSIELLIMDQADVFLMQNWDHVLHLFDHLHLQPRQGHGVDFSRVRMWTLNGWSKHYRQTLIFSSIILPELVHRKSCKGSVCQVVVQLPQMFHNIKCTDFQSLADTRFEFFLKEVLPLHREKDMKQTLIYIPSYFDFVRLRNYFKKEVISFVHINEYASSKGIRRARIEFRRRRAHFLLYTERLHFYRRFKLRGLKHIIFYELPQYAHFYSEMCNLLEDPGRISAISTDTLTCTVIFSKYEAHKLAEVVGTERAKHMLTSDRDVHMLISGDRE
ncbi:hypothetical protein BaRGS_00005415 [Batillaria attramentaria]|uniref:U3 small nucleolar RNA-associated protein 25 homolog n=1 Tax=Batillaria attramentaria TaxID=370345 RepID=A0ABD0LV32_9CAEN